MKPQQEATIETKLYDSINGNLLLLDLFQVAGIKNEDGMAVIEYINKPNGGSVAYVRHDAMVNKLNALIKDLSGSYVSLDYAKRLQELSRLQSALITALTDYDFTPNAVARVNEAKGELDRFNSGEEKFFLYGFRKRKITYSEAKSLVEEFPSDDDYIQANYSMSFNPEYGVDDNSIELHNFWHACKKFITNN